MEKLSSIISKKIISLEEGRLCGYVLDLIFDFSLKHFEGCLVADDENENTFFLRRASILSQGDDCIVIDGDNALELEISSTTNNPIGKDVYDTKGVSLGRVVDVFACGKNVKKIITNKCEIPQKFIQKVGANFLIFGLSKNSQISKNKPIFKNEEKIKNLNEKMPKVVVASQTTLINNEIKGENQMRIFANPNSLIGRTITSDLFGMNHEIIARKNEIINKKIINTAKNHNKLNILSYFSR